MLRNLFQTSEEMIEDYRKLRQRLDEIDNMAVEFAERLALQKSMIDGVDSMPTDRKGKALAKYSEFIREHERKVAGVVNERARIMKSMEGYRRDRKIGTECLRIDAVAEVRKHYRQGKLNKSAYFDIIKSIAGQPVKYADVLAQDEQTGKFLVLHRVDDFVPTGKVCLPGGHVDEGEDFFDAAIRELKEETNLDPIKGSQVVDLGEYRSKDAWIHYFLVKVDGKQPVTVDSSEHCFSEWVYIQNFAVMPFIYDQGLLAMKKYFNQNFMYKDVELILDAYKEGRLTQEVYLATAGSMVKKAMEATENVAPLVPESMEGDTKVIFAVRDANRDIEKLIKAISGSEEITVGGNRMKLVKPIFIRNVSYMKDPSDNYLTQMEVVYSGDENDMRRILENFSASLKYGGALKVEAAEEEFTAANERGSDYVGDPIFCDNLN